MDEWPVLVVGVHDSSVGTAFFWRIIRTNSPTYVYLGTSCSNKNDVVINETIYFVLRAQTADDNSTTRFLSLVVVAPVTRVD